MHWRYPTLPQNHHYQTSVQCQTHNFYSRSSFACCCLLFTYCIYCIMTWFCFYQTRSAWSVDQGSNKNHSPACKFAPTVTKFGVMWEGLSLPHDTKFGNCRCKFVDSRAFPSWSLIHGLRWSSLIKAEPGGWFNIKMPSYQYRNTHCGDKMIILLPSYLHNAISHDDKMASSSWIRTLQSTYPTLLPPPKAGGPERDKHLQLEMQPICME